MPGLGYQSRQRYRGHTEVGFTGCQRLIVTQYHNNPRGLPMSVLSEQARKMANELDNPPL